MTEYERWFHELSGVISNVEVGGFFDEVSKNTLIRVRTEIGLAIEKEGKKNRIDLCNGHGGSGFMSDCTKCYLAKKGE